LKLDDELTGTTKEMLFSRYRVPEGAGTASCQLKRCLPPGLRPAPAAQNRPFGEPIDRKKLPCFLASWICLQRAENFLTPGMAQPSVGMPPLPHAYAEGALSPTQSPLAAGRKSCLSICSSGEHELELLRSQPHSARVRNFCTPVLILACRAILDRIM
jgi:hypothetical protein